MRKSIFLVIFIFLAILIFSDIKDINTSVYNIQFKSKNIKEHLVGVELINNNKEMHEGDIEIIKLLLNEIKYDQISNPLSNAAEEDYIKLKVKALQTIGNIGTPEVSKYILRILGETKYIDVKAACVKTLGQIGDDDKYMVTRSIFDYYNNINLESIKDKNDFCIASIDSFYYLSEDKPLEIIEYVGIISLFKLFMNKEIFSDKIYDYSKRKLLNLMIKNS